MNDFYQINGFQVKNNQDVLLQLGLAGIDSEVYLSYLVLDGSLVRLSPDNSLHMDSYLQAKAKLVELFARQETLTLGEFRDLLGSGRKQVQALLELFDSCKYTRRVDDSRVAWQLPD